MILSSRSIRQAIYGEIGERGKGLHAATARMVTERAGMETGGL